MTRLWEIDKKEDPCGTCNDAHVIPYGEGGTGTGVINCPQCGETMGGNDFRGYLYSLGISRRAMAELAEVREKTIARWIDDYWELPYDVHKLVRDLDEYVTDAIRYLLLEHKGPVLRAEFYFTIGEFREKLDTISPLFSDEIRGSYYRNLMCDTIDRRIDEFQRTNNKFKGESY